MEIIPDIYDVLEVDQSCLQSLPTDFDVDSCLSELTKNIRENAEKRKAEENEDHIGEVTEKKPRLRRGKNLRKLGIATSRIMKREALLASTNYKIGRKEICMGYCPKNFASVVHFVSREKIIMKMKTEDFAKFLQSKVLTNFASCTQEMEETSTTTFPKASLKVKMMFYRKCLTMQLSIKNDDLHDDRTYRAYLNGGEIKEIIKIIELLKYSTSALEKNKNKAFRYIQNFYELIPSGIHDYDHFLDSFDSPIEDSDENAVNETQNIDFERLFIELKCNFNDN